MLARKKAPATQKLCTTPSNNVALAWLRMITGLIDDAHFRVMWMAWQSMEAQSCNNADLRMMPALPAAGTGDALESLYTFYNNPRGEDRTKKNYHLIRYTKRALRQRFTNRCWCEVQAVSQRCIITLMEHKLAPKEVWSLRNDSEHPCKDLRAQLMKSTYESLESLLPRKIVENETAPTRTTPEKHATNHLAVPTIA